jgi:hypothetical protein
LADGTVVPITLDTGTSLSDGLGAAIPATLENGQITFSPQGSVAPEPSSLILLSTGLGGLAAVIWRRRWVKR